MHLAGFGGCQASVASLIRELTFDHATSQLVSYPVAEYARLHNATFVDGKTFRLTAGAAPQTLPVPAAEGGALDIHASFDLRTLTGTSPGSKSSGFGLVVRADASLRVRGSSRGISITFSVGKVDAAGTRLVNASVQHTQATPPPPPSAPILPYMNNTDLPGGDYHTTRLPPHTDPHQCGHLCMKDPACMVWVFVIRDQPVGSGDCIFKNELHACPVPSPHSTKQGICVAGRGNEPVGTNCHNDPAPPLPKAWVLPAVAVLRGETLDVRVLVDRPVVEFYVQGGRASFTVASQDFSVEQTAVRLYSAALVGITATNVSVHGMACGWTSTPPIPGQQVKKQLTN